MTGLFITLGIAILTLLTIVLWFLPHLWQQQALRIAHETTTLREMIGEIINEQETVALQQARLDTSVAYLQDQVAHITTHTSQHPGHDSYIAALLQNDTLQSIEQRVSGLQSQIEDQQRHYAAHSQQDAESWLRLMELLGNMQERIGMLSAESPEQPAHAANGGGGNGHTHGEMMGQHYYHEYHSHR